MTETPKDKRETVPSTVQHDGRHATDFDEMRRYRFEDLAEGARRIKITLGETAYELRLTRNGRLVLHK